VDNLSRDLKIKMHEDAIVKVLDNMPRVEKILLLKHLPVMLGLRPGSDLDYEISNECRKSEAP
jgi:hypothetical protein